MTTIVDNLNDPIEKPGYHLNIHPEFSLGRFTDQVSRACYAWRNSLRTIDAGSFYDEGKQRLRSVPDFVIADNYELTPEALRQEEHSEVVLNLTRALIDFVDTLLGLQALRGVEIHLERDLHGEQAILEYVEELIAERARTVGADRKLSNPAKVETFNIAVPVIREAILSLLDVRQALEHHKRVATRKDISLRFWRLKVEVDGGEEFKGEPMDLKAGQHLLVGFEPVIREFPVGEPIVLSEEDIENIARTLMLTIGPDLLKAAFLPALDETPSE